MSREAYLEIREVGHVLAVGEQASGRLCPFCKGGTSKDLSFSITRTPSSVLFICHRAGCGRKGNIPMTASSTELPVRTPPKRDAEQGWRLSHLPPEVRDELWTKYLIDEDMVKRAGILWEIEQKRLWLPIKADDRMTMGVNLRSLEKGVKPKARIHISDASRVPAAFYFRTLTSDLLYLVEDQFSAIRLAKYVNSCALLGTHLSDSLLLSIKKLRVEEVVIALDKDAYEKAIQMYKKLVPLVDRVCIVRLEKDIKDMTEEALKELLYMNEQELIPKE